MMIFALVLSAAIIWLAIGPQIDAWLTVEKNKFLKPLTWLDYF